MSVSGWITCHCGQDVPGYLAGPGKHVRPSGATCPGIDERVHTPSVCLECKSGTHGVGFARVLDVIRWESYGPDEYSARGFRAVTA